MLAAIAALWIQPAKAVTFEISGTATGTISGTEACDSEVGFCWVSRPWVLPFSLTLDESFMSLYQDGVTREFWLGPSFNAGFWNGTFRDLGGNLYQGIYAAFSQHKVGCGLELRPDCSFYASTSEFSVVDADIPAVPEPATWALMLIGFGAIAWAMRKAPLRNHQAISTFGQM